ncbi:MAG: hypothetical protein WBQ51_09880 [Candidatus Sulfotelmatobacter sp.]
MKKRKIVAALIYGTSAFCVFFYFEFLDSMEPPRSDFEYVLLGAAAMFAIASVLSFFKSRWAAICALAAAILSSPLLYSARLYWAHNIAWRLNYGPDELTARISLIVAVVYSIRQLWLSFRTGGGLIEPKSKWWVLPATTLYAITMLAIANWHGIWDWLFRLRYGS